MIETLRTITEGEIELIALENILNAKLTQLVASKNVRFKQYANSEPMPLGYYAFCFLPSGVGKDKAVRFIDNCYMPFLKDKITAIIDKYKADLQQELYYKASLLDKNDKKAAEREADEIIAKVRPCNINIADATFTALYYQAELIEKTNYGSIFIKIMELGDTIRDAVKGDGTAKELLPKLKDMSDGDINPRLTASDNDRHEIKNISVSGLFCCDYNPLLKSRNNEYLMEFLDSGMARRSFIYFFDKSIKLNTIELDWKKEEKAYQDAANIRQWLEETFDKIPLNMICEFSAEAKDRLTEFKKECKNEKRRFMDSDELLAKAYGGAYWIVTKLAVVKSILKCPTNSMVDIKYVDEAIDFYRRIKPYLSIVVDKRPDSPEELLKKFLTKQKDGAIITRTQIKNLNLHKGNFKDWCDDALDEIKRELGFVYDWKGSGRATGVQIRKGNI